MVKRWKTWKTELKSTSKPSFLTQKIFYNNLGAIHKMKTTLMLSKTDVCVHWECVPWNVYIGNKYNTNVWIKVIITNQDYY